jgi:hypothetical protein
MVAAPAAPGHSSTMEEVVRAQLVRALSILKEKITIGMHFCHEKS